MSTVKKVPSSSSNSLLRQHTLIRRCMAIILKADDLDNSDGDSFKTKSSRECPSDGPRPPSMFENTLCRSLFQDMVEQNSECYWNPSLVQSVRDLEYKGCIVPTTLLVSGSEYSLEVVRSAWSRRMLKPPSGYNVSLLGDLDPVQLTVVPQTQFAPLPEALCKVVYDLNTEGMVANMALIGSRLRCTFPEISLPNENVLYRALGSLIRDRKLYHTGHGYSVVTPDTFRLLAMSPPLERQMLLTNDEAIVRLHGTVIMDGKSACTQTNQRERLTSWSSAERIVSPSPIANGKLKRCHSLKLLRGRDKEKLCRSNSFRSSRAKLSNQTSKEAKSDVENVDPNKKERGSMFSKFFRRGRSKTVVPKCASASSQFPPRDRSDPDFVHYNSRSTQTFEADDNRPPKSNKSRSRSLNRMWNRDRHLVPVNAAAGNSRTKSGTFPSDSIYHYRSSSVPRKASPSPKRDSQKSDNALTSTKKKSIMLKPVPPSLVGQASTSSRVPTWNPVKTSTPYQSPFSPIPKPQNGASNQNVEKCNSSNQTRTQWPVRPLPTLSVPYVKPESSILSRSYAYHNGSSLPWRSLVNPMLLAANAAIGEPKKPIPVVGTPQRIIPREVTSGPVTTTVTNVPKPQITKTVTENIVTTETTTTQKKGLAVEGTVDVEINVGPFLAKSSTNPGSIPATAKNDLLKIATSWNHSVSNKLKTDNKSNETNNGNNSTLTTTTSITTSVSHPNCKESLKPSSTVVCQDGQDLETSGDTRQEITRSSPKPETTSLISSRSKLAEAKRDFFCESPSPTEPQSLKDDSGFSSSASTSRPMSVSPC